MDKNKKVRMPKKVGRPTKKVIPEGEWEAKEIIMDQVIFWMERMATCKEIASSFRTDKDTLKSAIKRETGLNYSQLKERITDAGKLRLRKYHWKMAETNAHVNMWLSKIYLGMTEPDNKSSSPNDEKLDAILSSIKS